MTEVRDAIVRKQGVGCLDFPMQSLSGFAVVLVRLFGTEFWVCYAFWVRTLDTEPRVR